MSLSDYVKNEGRSLPVFMLLDTSGSMEGEKIQALNVALKEMIYKLKNIENPKGIIKLCLLTFGGDNVTVIKKLSEINDNDIYILEANGKTPMGKAFEKIAEIIEDEQIVDNRSYTPTIVLISDGNPTDFNVEGLSYEDIVKWESLKKLVNGRRSSKATRLALGIGEDLDVNILKAFINNEKIPIISAKEANTIETFLQWVTMSISVRSLSNNPNDVFIEDTSTFGEDEVVF